MEACGSVPEALAFRAEVERGKASAGRQPHTVRVVARLNACITSDGGLARDVVRPTAARYLARGSLRLATAAAQGLILPPEVTAPMANAPYAEGVKPYLPLLPLISDRHVDALTLAGNSQEVTAHVRRLSEAGIDAVIIRPIAGNGISAEDTIAAFGAIWPTITQA